MDSFHELPSAALAFLLVAFTIGISLLGLLLSARWFRKANIHRNLGNGPISALLSASIGVYAIAAGLTAVAVWENLVDASTNVGREVAAITVLFHSLDGYPETLQMQGKQMMEAYTRHIIDNEWPLHKRGDVPRGTLELLERAQKAFFAFEPGTEGQKIVHAEIVQAFNRIIEHRRLRLQTVQDTALPAELWMVVTLLGVIAIASCFLLRVESLRMHVLITSLVAAPIALLLFFIAVTDRPFQGGVHVSSKPFQTVLEEIIVPDLARRK